MSTTWSSSKICQELGVVRPVVLATVNVLAPTLISAETAVAVPTDPSNKIYPVAPVVVTPLKSKVAFCTTMFSEVGAK